MQFLAFWLFSICAAIAGDGFDHSHSQFTTFLGSSVSNSGVNYTELASRRSQLGVYLSQLERAPVDTFSKDQKIALWVNAYNAYTVALILDEGQPKSIMDLDGGKVWDTRKYIVGGQRLTLNEMEHKRARPLTDGRIHGALNCASKGCPPLGPKALRANGLDAQLDEAAKRWVATNAYTRTGGAVAVSHIFEWFAEDFKQWGGDSVAGAGEKESAALRFIEAFGAEKEAGLRTGSKTVTYQPYDWALNAR